MSYLTVAVVVLMNDSCILNLVFQIVPFGHSDLILEMR